MGEVLKGADRPSLMLERPPCPERSDPDQDFVTVLMLSSLDSMPAMGFQQVMAAAQRTQIADVSGAVRVADEVVTVA